MERYDGFGMRAISLVVLVTSTCMAEDFLYVFATPPGQRSEIHWVPASKPQTARVLLEDLDQTEVVYRHRGELWWFDRNRLVAADLVGRNENVPSAFDIVDFDRITISDLVRQGDILYWLTGGQVVRSHLLTGELQVLVSGSSRLGGLAVYEDRLYFDHGIAIESIRLDGSDRRQIGTKDARVDSRRASRGLAVHDGRLIWVNESLVNKRSFRQFDLESGKESLLVGELPGEVIGVTVTDSAVYWVDGTTVWRWKHGANEHEPLYQLGDTRITAITAVSASPMQAAIDENRRIQVFGAEGESYQLLYSEDLESWSPDFVRGSLFSENGSLSWLRPTQGAADEPVSWQPRAQARRGYFAAWRYAFEPLFDADEDGLPDYWERRHFGDLSANPDVDSNGNGLTHLDEARLFIGPTEEDSDGDGLSNEQEFSFVPPLNPASSDTDGDGLTDGDEVNVHDTDPHLTDTDADGFTDDFELTFGGDPNESGVQPSRDEVLARYAEDLVVHFGFESSEDLGIPNTGVLGEHGRIVGDGAQVTGDQEAENLRTVLEFTHDPDNPRNFSHFETNYTLEDLGLTTEDVQMTIAMWLRFENAREGTFLSAVSPGGTRPAISLGVFRSVQNRLSPLRVSFRGTSFGNSVVTGSVIPEGIWTHVVWVFEFNAMTVYVDGVQHVRNEDLRLGPLEGDPKLWLGAEQGRQRAVEGYYGALDDVRIYRQALSANVIKLLAK